MTREKTIPVGTKVFVTGCKKAVAWISPKTPDLDAYEGKSKSNVLKRAIEESKDLYLVKYLCFHPTWGWVVAVDTEPRSNSGDYFFLENLSPVAETWANENRLYSISTRQLQELCKMQSSAEMKRSLVSLYGARNIFPRPSLAISGPLVYCKWKAQDGTVKETEDYSRTFQLGDIVKVYDGSYNADVATGEHRHGIDSLFKEYTAEIVGFSDEVEYDPILDHCNTMNLRLRFNDSKNTEVYCAPNCVKLVKKKMVLPEWLKVGEFVAENWPDSPYYKKTAFKVVEITAGGEVYYDREVNGLSSCEEWQGFEKPTAEMIVSYYRDYKKM